jgi:hypothetical protein
MTFPRGALVLAGGMALASCKDPTIGAGFADPLSGAAINSFLSINEDCPAGSDWIPPDGSPPPPVRQFVPPPHPDTECPFYRGAYQNFLIATVPLGNNAGPGQSPGDPVLVNYPTIDDAFTSTIPHLQRNTGTPYPYGVDAHNAVATGPATGRAWLGAIRQAGQRNILVDQDDHTLFYGLHMNKAFYDFIQANKLTTPEAIKNVDPYLSFPPGLVEFKTAWKDIDPQDFPDANGNYGTPNGIVPPPPLPDDLKQLGGQQLTWDDNYITTMAWLPYLTQDATTHVVNEDADHPVLRKVALVAVHSVYTLPGHPEFVWGSIQHVNIYATDPGPVAYANATVLGAPDSQPNNSGPSGVASLPDPNDPQNSKQTSIASTSNYLLYKGGTPVNQADQPLDTTALTLNEATQSFPGQQESVYRMFPGSKSNDLAPDSAVFSLNSNIGYAFSQAIAQGLNTKIDKRQNYRLVAAVWLDKPYFFGLSYPGPATGLLPNGSPVPLGTPPTGVTFQNDDTNPLVIDASQPKPTYYPMVSQGITCGTPLDSTNTSGDDPNASGSNNAVPTCLTRKDDLANGDNPSKLYQGYQVDPKTGKLTTTIGAPTVGTDYEFSILGGEDRLSSTSMETFTQNNGFRNCFTCHNTQPVNYNGTPATQTDVVNGTVLLAKPAMINVSHLFSEFILRDQEAIAAAAGFGGASGVGGTVATGTGGVGGGGVGGKGGATSGGGMTNTGGNTGGSVSGAGGEVGGRTLGNGGTQGGGAVASTGGSGGTGGSSGGQGGAGDAATARDARAADVGRPDSPQLTNLVNNGNFSNGETEWQISVSAGIGVNHSIVRGEFCVNLPVNAVATVGYPVDLTAAFALVANTTYELSYQVSSTSQALNFEAKVGNAVAPFANIADFMAEPVGLNALRTNTHVFTPTVDSMTTGVAFTISTGATASTVCLDNVSVAAM